MGLLDEFERRLESAINGPFRRAFHDVVEPVEIASRLQQEMDRRAAIISRGRTVVPNAFTVDLSTHDFERLVEIADVVRAELSSMVKEHATNQRYTFLGAVRVDLQEDPTLNTGDCRIRSATEQAAPVRVPDPEIINPAAHPQLVVAGRVYRLSKARTRIGRGTGVDISLDDPGVSRSHAEIVLGSPPVIRDLGSTNGTSVDGRKIAEAPLHEGAQITVGNTTMTFRGA